VAAAQPQPNRVDVGAIRVASDLHVEQHCLTLGFQSCWRVNPPPGEWRDLPGGSQKRFASKASTTSLRANSDLGGDQHADMGASLHETNSEIRRLPD